MSRDTARPWPSQAGWLTGTEPQMRLAIVFRALADLGVCETPPGSNRGGRIDEWNRRAEAPPASYWCEAWANAVWTDAGAETPPSLRASTDAMIIWGKQTKRWRPVSATPEIGDQVLYGKTVAGALDANHVGIVVRVTPYLLTVEGNTGFGGFDRNGEAVVLKKPEPARILGYVSPIPLA